MLSAYREVYGPDTQDDINYDNWKNIRDILQVWENSKSNLFKAFGEKLILSKEIRVTKNEGILVHDFHEKISNKCNPFWKYFCPIASNTDSSTFQKTMKQNGFKIKNFFQLVNTRTWVNNSLGRSIEVKFPEGDSISSQKGGSPARFMNKLIKRALKGDYISQEQADDWEEFRILHSQILNDATLEGELCLSIHPMDFLTASDNDCGWTSCLRFRRTPEKDFGDYRAGTLEMMNSPFVVCAYLKSKKDMEIVRDPLNEELYYWNNKHWRSFYVCAADGLISMRGFPYDCEAIDNIVLDWLADIFNKYEEIQYYPDKKIRVTSPRELQEAGYGWWNFSTQLMYNDFWRQHTFIPSNKTQGGDTVNITDLGTKTQCLFCGEMYPPDTDFSHRLSCDRCEEQIEWCELCGVEVATNANGLCDECFDENLVYDLWDILTRPEEDIKNFVKIQHYNSNGYTSISSNHEGSLAYPYAVTRHGLVGFPEKFVNENFKQNPTLFNLTPLAVDTLLDKMAKGLITPYDIFVLPETASKHYYSYLLQEGQEDLAQQYLTDIYPLMLGDRKYSSYLASDIIHYGYTDKEIEEATMRFLAAMEKYKEI